MTAPILNDILCDYSKHINGKTGEETSDKGEEGSKETVIDVDEKRAESSNKTRNNGTNKANNQDEDLGKDLKDGVQNGVELRSDAKNGKLAFDDGSDLGNESDNESMNSLDIRVRNIEASRTSKLSDEVGKGVWQAVEPGEGLVGTFILGEVPTLDFVKNVA